MFLVHRCIIPRQPEEAWILSMIVFDDQHHSHGIPTGARINTETAGNSNH
jgi:hypothetical protein